MKKITKLVLVLFLGFTSLNTNSQIEEYLGNDYMNRWVVRLGFNVVEDNGSASTNPFNDAFSLDEEAYHGIPLKLDIEYRIDRIFAVELAGSMNKWKAGKSVIENIPVTTDKDYFAIDANVKVYYDNLFNIFENADWLELNASIGLGYFEQEEFGTTFNLGTGANFWITNHLGINMNAVAKWAIHDPNKFDHYDTNHVQYTLGLSYRFQDQDKDKDGVYDYNDDCPLIPGTRKGNGCPEKEFVKAKTVKYDAPETKTITRVIDSDGDGVIDSIDKCPKVYGLESNNGCPQVVVQQPQPVTQEVVYDRSEIERLSRQINFNTNKDVFTQKTYSVLQNIISFVNRYPSSRFIISGHTDSDGSEANNLALSQRRADAVKEYLIKNGVSSYNIMQAVGYGESQPIGSNATSEGKRMNRRVEISQVD